MTDGAEAAGSGPAAARARVGGGKAAAHGPADWLCLAATPSFAGMALVAGAFGTPPDGLCTAAQEAAPLTGMTAIYLLMSAFHASPWLRLVFSRGRAGAAR